MELIQLNNRRNNTNNNNKQPINSQTSQFEYIAKLVCMRHFESALNGKFDRNNFIDSMYHITSMQTKEQLAGYFEEINAFNLGKGCGTIRVEVLKGEVVLYDRKRVVRNYNNSEHDQDNRPSFIPFKNDELIAVVRTFLKLFANDIFSYYRLLSGALAKENIRNLNVVKENGSKIQQFVMNMGIMPNFGNLSFPDFCAIRLGMSLASSILVNDFRNEIMDKYNEKLGNTYFAKAGIVSKDGSRGLGLTLIPIISDRPISLDFVMVESSSRFETELITVEKHEDNVYDLDFSELLGKNTSVKNELESKNLTQIPIDTSTASNIVNTSEPISESEGEDTSQMPEGF